MTQPRPPKNLLTHLVTGIGYLTDPKSPPGKLFNRFETATSKVFDRLARSHTFLRIAGKGLNLGFMVRRSVTAGAEAWLHAWQAPTLGDVQAMRTQLRQLGDRLEVTQTQLELALDALARVEADLRATPRLPETP
ncbi:MAG: hypothetical protein H0T76_00545 [Nannocystis sp.]|nr:hypothetical protein [Nannocystis sp.]MBA3544948.1 hypothetical protein [Nannocystis sp.]